MTWVGRRHECTGGKTKQSIVYMLEMVPNDDLNNEQTKKVAAAFLVKAPEKREEEGMEIEEEGAETPSTRFLGPQHSGRRTKTGDFRKNAAKARPIQLAMSFKRLWQIPEPIWGRHAVTLGRLPSQPPTGTCR